MAEVPFLGHTAALALSPRVSHCDLYEQSQLANSETATEETVAVAICGRGPGRGGAGDGRRETKRDEMSPGSAWRRTAMCRAGWLALLAFWMAVFFMPRLIVGFVCYFGGRTDKQTPPYSQVLAYRSAAVCQIALHGVSLKVRVCISQIIASLF